VLKPGRASWTLPLDAVRADPAGDAAEVTSAQVRDAATRVIEAGQRHDGDPGIMVISDAGYDLTRLAWLLRDLPGDRSPKPPWLWSSRKLTCAAEVDRDLPGAAASFPLFVVAAGGSARLRVRVPGSVTVWGCLYPLRCCPCYRRGKLLPRRC
jgi:hypothetical protein